jgi:hypothetical protein
VISVGVVGIWLISVRSVDVVPDTAVDTPEVIVETPLVTVDST